VIGIVAWEIRVKATGKMACAHFAPWTSRYKCQGHPDASSSARRQPRSAQAGQQIAVEKAGLTFSICQFSDLPDFDGTLPLSGRLSIVFS